MQDTIKNKTSNFKKIDSELFYSNLPEVHPNVAYPMMRKSQSTLKNISEYLARAKKAKEKMKFRMFWIRSERNDFTVSEKESNPRGKNSEKGVWIELKEHPDDDPEKIENTFRAFSDAKIIMEDGKRGKWIKVLDSSTETEEILVEKEPETELISLRPDTYAIEMERKAIFTLMDRPNVQHKSLVRLLEDIDRVKWPQVKPSIIADWKVLTDEKRPGTYEQRQFVEMALGTPDFAFLEGPPGSGKTTAICEYILQVIAKGGRVLLCASTHVAVDNVLERLKDKSEVIAVRIGEKHNMSDEVRHLQLDDRKKTETRELKIFLQTQKHPEESQKYLLNALSQDNDNLITDLVLDCANLVCGTTIGILQHPLIKASKESPRPIYDVMILDEASKTTFQEFLVPALYAKKWVLVGDVKQLSPYVDDVDISSNIESLLTKMEGDACVNTFNCLKGMNLLVVENDSKNRELYSEQARASGVEVALLDEVEKMDSASAGLTIMGSQLIVGSKQSVTKSSDYLPMDTSFVIGDFHSSDYERRRNYWKRLHKKQGLKDEELEDNLWHLQIAWRLIRAYELRSTEGGSDSYLKDVEKLIPDWSNELSKHVQNAIISVSKIALPSVIELLQDGFERGQNQHGSVLSDGFEEKDLKQRHVLLSYQHRMHPEISKFPRLNIYGNSKLDQSGCLNDPPYMEAERQWGYNRYKARALWIDVKGKMDRKKNFNFHEVNLIVKELDHFIKWAELNPRKDEKAWEVAILPFYKSQEKELRRKLQKNFRTRNTRNFWSNNKEVHISLCTVDRFQGHEADLVFLSFVKSRGVGFLDSPHRLNVALTRARYQLVLVGNKDNFKKQKRSELLQKLAVEIPAEISYRGGK